ncbi:MAG: ribbon-helix-helix domain-containing protein [Planctomycetes bacterium]|nr:ribbon-helix-helix domain-containing protein [Planctomycetota bacterium]
MPATKIQISVEEPVLEQIERLVEETGMSRNEIFRMVIREFVSCGKKKELIEQVDAVYDFNPRSPAEEEQFQQMQDLGSELLEDDW